MLHQDNTVLLEPLGKRFARAVALVFLVMFPLFPELDVFWNNSCRKRPRERVDVWRFLTRDTGRETGRTQMSQDEEEEPHTDTVSEVDSASPRSV